MNQIDRNKNFMFLSASFCGICLALLAIVNIFTSLKSMNHSAIQYMNQITIEGTGYVNATPSVGIITLNVREVATVISDAQNTVKEKVQNILKSLSEMEINQEDIKTESYNLMPKYEYPQAPSCLRAPCPSAPKPVLLGYEASQSILVKVREINKIDSIFALFGKLQITEFFGPNFIVDDLGKSKDDARTKAISDAKIKAVKLAKDLGVKLGRITSFSEQGNIYQASMAKGGLTGFASTSENSSNMNLVTPGESKITSNVIVTYEIQ